MRQRDEGQRQRDVNQSHESLGFNLPLLLCWETEITGDNAVTLQLWARPVIVLCFHGEREESRASLLLHNYVVPGHVYRLLGVLSSHQQYL